MRKCHLLIGIIFLLSFGLLNSQSFQLRSTEFTISGTSNLHDWVSEVTEVNWQGQFSFADNELQSVNGVKLTIPVEGIISSKGRIMDNKTHNALLVDDHPNITFKVSNANIATTQAGTYSLQVKGSLTMAGTSRTITIPVKMIQQADGGVQATGSKTLQMTDFGIDPPKALMGALTTGDEVTIRFNLTLSPF